MLDIYTGNFLDLQLYFWIYVPGNMDKSENLHQEYQEIMDISVNKWINLKIYGLNRKYPAIPGISGYIPLRQLT